MKRWALGMALLLIFGGAIALLRSFASEQKIIVTWDIVKTEVNKLEISANFTAGDVVKLSISPNRQWTPEPPVEDVPYPHIFVFVNITSPYGDNSSYEIAYVDYLVYNVRLVYAGGFSGEVSNETVKTENAIVGEVLYSGQYLARIVGVLNPGGPPMAEALTFYEKQESIVTEFPYRDYLKVAIVVFFLGSVLTIWSVKASDRRTRAKKKLGKNR